METENPYNTLSSEIKNRKRLQDALASIYFLALEGKDDDGMFVKIAEMAKEAYDE